MVTARQDDITQGRLAQELTKCNNLLKHSFRLPFLINGHFVLLFNKAVRVIREIKHHVHQQTPNVCLQ